ncbi:hypothetical protein ABER02_18165 [Rossellomorea marisflavi]|uniref:AbiTii domain-containing protein n=1 Tax=Rossellomorea marisflavi TaxID=189381 RepID=UPI003D2C0461
MEKSNIIREFASGEVNLENTMMRLKVILSDLSNQEMNQWIDYELRGYPQGVELPVYRQFIGVPVGNFYEDDLMHNNSRVPLAHLPIDFIKELLTVSVNDSIRGIESLSETTETVKIPKSMDVCRDISTNRLVVMGMSIFTGKNNYDNILMNIKATVLEILLKLEKEFGNLDTLDIPTRKITPTKVESITSVIINNTYNDHSIEVGNDNTFKSSEIGHRS